MGNFINTLRRRNTKNIVEANYVNQEGQDVLGVAGEIMLVDENGVPIVIGGGGGGTGFVPGAAVGASTGGDFITMYISPTELDATILPPGMNPLYTGNIEFIREIGLDGKTIATYTPADSEIILNGTTIEVANAAFDVSSSFIIGTNVQKPVNKLNAYNSNQLYCNTSGEFSATITDSTNDIVVAGLSFPIDATNVISIKLIDSTNSLIDLPVSNISVNAGVITVWGYDLLFLTGDIAIVTIAGPEKTYNLPLDATKVVVQNPDWTHTTVNSLLGSDTDLGDVVLVAENAVASPNFEYGTTMGLLALGIDYPDNDGDIDGGFASNVTTSELGPIISLTDTEVGTTMGGAGVWNPGDSGRFAEIRRFTIPFDTYKYLSLQIQLDVTAADNEMNFAIYASNNPLATDQNFDYWTSITTRFTSGSTQQSGLGVLNLFLTNSKPIVAEQLMVAVDGYCLDPTGTVGNSFEIYFKKA